MRVSQRTLDKLGLYQSIFVEEYNDQDGGGGFNIVIQRDEFGE